MLLVKSFQTYVYINNHAKVSSLHIFIFPDKFFKVSYSSEVVCSLTFFKMQYCFCCYLLLEGLKCFVYDLELQKKGYTIFSECTMKFCTTKIKFSQYYYYGINYRKFVYVDLPITRMKIMKKHFQ